MTEEQIKQLHEKYVKLMQEQTENHDIENAHCAADDLLCDLLVDLGFKDVVEIYSGIQKWYA